uniref:PhnD/SsuA/transferrin family substrate-binding protein n=1 Tax=Parasutterella excrementihominis TaxID=487175 RepID=UPI0026654C1D
MLSNLGISLAMAGFLLTACPLISAETTDAQTAPVYLYGVEFTRPSFELKIAKETYEVIQRAIEPRKLIVRNVTTAGLDEAIKKRKADIVIANSGIYRRYLQNGWRDVLTLATGVQPNPDQAVGSLILANKKLGINTIEDLKGHSIALNTPSAFQGTLTIKKELLDRHYDPDTFFSKILYLGINPQKRLEAVRNGEADSTFLSVCYAEGLDAVGVKPNLSSHCLTSTDLYPNFSLLVSSNLSSQMIRQIAENLLRIKPNADGEYWTLASDYDPVDKMYEALKEGPYQHLKSWTLTRIWNEFKTLILLLILSLLFAIWHIYATGKAVYKATNDILKATQDQKKKAEEIQSIKNALVVSSLSSVIAHELGQPLAACLFYANSLDKLLKNWTAAKKAMALEAAEALQQQLTRVTDILSIVQNYAAKRKSKKE